MTINEELLNGHLLGDCSLINTNIRKNKHYSFTMCSKHKEYLKWLTETFDLLENRPVWDKTRFDKRTQKFYEAFYIRSLSSEILTEKRALWYPKGIKIIPKNLILTPKTLLHWFLDDGGRATSGGIYLATDGFTPLDIQYLVACLERDFGFEAVLHKNDESFRIYIPKPQTPMFYDLIQPCPVKCFDYKWIT